MANNLNDKNRELMLDGNAAAGILHQIFALEMTATPTECVHCGNISEIGALLVFNQAPGMVLRCPTCENVLMRIVETTEAIYLDTRGVVYLRLGRQTGW